MQNHSQKFFVKLHRCWKTVTKNISQNSKRFFVVYLGSGGWQDDRLLANGCCHVHAHERDQRTQPGGGAWPRPALHDPYDHTRPGGRGLPQLHRYVLNYNTFTGKSFHILLFTNCFVTGTDYFQTNFYGKSINRQILLFLMWYIPHFKGIFKHSYCQTETNLHR